MGLTVTNVQNTVNVSGCQSKSEREGGHQGVTILLITDAAHVRHTVVSLVGAGAQVLSLLALHELNIQGAQRLNQSQQKPLQSLFIFLL